jgi:hypothetical protein
LGYNNGFSQKPAAYFINNTVYSYSATAALFNAIPKKCHWLLDYAEYKHLGKRCACSNPFFMIIANILDMYLRASHL